MVTVPAAAAAALPKKSHRYPAGEPAATARPVRNEPFVRSRHGEVVGWQVDNRGIERPDTHR
jgi:hypothetical protein